VVRAHDLEPRIEQVEILVDAVLVGPNDARRVGFELLPNFALTPFKIALFGLELAIPVGRPRRQRDHGDV
jgi:hypothetical protein